MKNKVFIDWWMIDVHTFIQNFTLLPILNISRGGGVLLKALPDELKINKAYAKTTENYLLYFVTCGITLSLHQTWTFTTFGAT